MSSPSVGCGEMCLRCGVGPRPGDDVQLSEIHKDGTVDVAVCEFLCYYHRKLRRNNGYLVALILEGSK